MITEIIIAAFVAHGLTSMLVHGYPTIRLANWTLRHLKLQEYSVPTVLVFWTVWSTISTPLIMYRMFMPSETIIEKGAEEFVKTRIRNDN